MTVSPFFYTASLTPPPAALVSVPGELVRSTEDQVLDALMPRIKRESLALDLSNVERIDAAGIAALILLYRGSVEAGTEFRVVDPSPRVLEVLRLVGLDTILVAETRPEAVRPGQARQNRPAA